MILLAKSAQTQFLSVKPRADSLRLSQVLDTE